MKNILIPLTIFIVIFISSCGGEEETSDVITALTSTTVRRQCSALTGCAVISVLTIPTAR